MKIIYLFIVMGWFGSLYYIYNHGEKNIENLLITSVKNNEREVTQLLDIAIAYNNSIKEQLITSFHLKDHLGENPLLSKLQDYPALNAYGLNIPPTKNSFPFNANLTGIGSVNNITPAGLAEINTILYLNFTAPVSGAIRQFKWSYYTSVNEFMILAPKLDITDFNFADKFYRKPFWTSAIPENNPKKETVISDLFRDSAAPGLIVSISTPVYFNNTFRGVVSLDVGLDYLNNVLQSSVVSAQKNMSLITKEGKIITNNGMLTGDKVGFEIDEITQSNQLFKLSGNYYVLSNLINGKFYVVYELSADELTQLTLENIYKLVAISLLVLIALLLFANMVTLYRKTKRLSEFDGLSDLYNRMTLETLSEIAIETSLKNEEPICIIMADIDFFKNVNDQYGHHVGDKGIIHVASILKNVARKTDIVGRYGGEEFMFTLPNCDIETATLFAERIRKKIAETSFHKGNVLQVSLGVVVCTYKNPLSFKELCKQADLALYEAKKTGRNKTVRYSDNLERLNQRVKNQ